jgi:hypothetical protein
MRVETSGDSTQGRLPRTGGILVLIVLKKMSSLMTLRLQSDLRPSGPPVIGNISLAFSDDCLNIGESSPYRNESDLTL